MIGTNSGIVINGNGKIDVIGGLAVGENASVNIVNQISNKWLKIDSWLRENNSNIQNYEALQEQINILKSQTNINISIEEKESIFKKITEAVGSIGGAIGLIKLIEEIF